MGIVIELCPSVTTRQDLRLYIPYIYNGIPQSIQLQ